MSNLHRIQWLDTELRNLCYPNSTHLATEFCISTRQAARDIEYLKYSLGAPLAYSAEKRGYFYTTKTFTLPALMIGEEEKAALNYLAEQYRAAGQQLTSQLADLFARLGGPVEHDKSSQAASESEDLSLPIYPLASKTLHFLNAIKEASLQKKKIRLQYLDFGHNRTERVVHPYVLFRRRAGTYLQCFCETREAERSLRIDRIAELTILQEDFLLPDKFSQQSFATGDFRFNYRLPYTARIRLDTPLPPAVLADFTPVPASSHTAASEAGYEYILNFYQSSQLLAGLVRLGNGFTILAPDWLRERYCDFLALLIEKNSKK